MASVPTHSPTYLSDVQLAERYGVARSTIWRWTDLGILPQPVKISAGCTRWSSAAIDRLDAERESQQEAAQG